MIVTDAMIQAAVNAPTRGDEGSYVFDYITIPENNDPDWKAVGGFPRHLHSHAAEVEWRWHLVKVMLEAALAAKP